MGSKKTAHYDKVIADSLTVTRWHQLKRIYKLNNNDTAKKKGEPGYDPCYKFDLVYKVLKANTINILSKAGLDLTGDETTWAHQGFGEKGAKVITCINEKPGVSKGGAAIHCLAT